MARETITLEGFESIRDAMQRMPDQVRVVMADVVQKTAFGARQRAIAMAPRATGNLRSMITSSSRGLSGRVEVGSSAYYWRFLEYGTKYVAARPFARPAAELESADFTERVRQAAVRLGRDFSAGRTL